MILTEDFILYDRHEKINAVAYESDERGFEFKIVSQILTSDEDELKEWIEENSDKGVFKITGAEKFVDGTFVPCDLVERIHTLEKMYDCFDEESKEHIDAVLQ